MTVVCFHGTAEQSTEKVLGLLQQLQDPPGGLTRSGVSQTRPSSMRLMTPSRKSGH